VWVENFRPDVKAKTRIFESESLPRSTRACLGSISLRPGAALHKRQWLRSDRAGTWGADSVTGAPGQGPMRSAHSPWPDLTAGLFSPIGILTAMLETRHVLRPGPVGADFAAAGPDFMLTFQGPPIAWMMEKEVAQQGGNNHPTSIRPRVQDLRTAIFNIRQPQAAESGALARHAGDRLAPELVTIRYATAPQRSKNRRTLKR